MAGQELPAGSTIYLSVSGGTDVEEVSMPNLYGYSKYSASSTLSSLGLTVGSFSYVKSDKDRDIVIWQNVPAGEKITKGSTVYLQVSEGPQETPTPSAEPSATPSTQPSVEPTDLNT
ncbi:MAG: PASTA domain-containing protein [Clostridia bacterium]|nr:PASTA domain-containing protein [Clostridia bacterium]